MKRLFIKKKLWYASPDENGEISQTISIGKIVLWGVLAITVLLMISFLWIYLTLPNTLELVNKNPKRTALMQARLDEAQAQKKKLRIRQRWIRFKSIPDLLKNSVRISEDASFYQHGGIDFEEMKNSFKRNLDEGRIVRGGSTITQQLAKNLYLSTDRSYFRKIKEFFIARRLEEDLSKNRIFHLYLNVIEWGRGIFGIQMAARSYFNTDASKLNLEQIVRLTAVIPKPLSEKPTGSSRWLKWRCKWILGKLLKYKYITQEQYDENVSAFK